MITFETRGSFKNTERFLRKLSKNRMYDNLDSLAKEGVAALASSTPKDSGETANLWDYEIKKTRNGVSITWINRNVVNGVPIAIILQYGHGTGTGGYVKGRDYINPAVKPVFDRIEKKVWMEVSR